MNTKNDLTYVPGYGRVGGGGTNVQGGVQRGSEQMGGSFQTGGDEHSAVVGQHDSTGHEAGVSMGVSHGGGTGQETGVSMGVAHSVSTGHETGVSMGVAHGGGTGHETGVSMGVAHGGGSDHETGVSMGGGAGHEGVDQSMTHGGGTMHTGVQHGSTGHGGRQGHFAGFVRHEGGEGMRTGGQMAVSGHRGGDEQSGGNESGHRKGRNYGRPQCLIACPPGTSLCQTCKCCPINPPVPGY